MPPLSSHSRLISEHLTGLEQRQAWPCGECSKLLDTVVHTQHQVKEVHDLDFQKDWLESARELRRELRQPETFVGHALLQMRCKVGHCYKTETMGADSEALFL